MTFDSGNQALRVRQQRFRARKAMICFAYPYLPSRSNTSGHASTTSQPRSIQTQEHNPARPENQQDQSIPTSSKHENHELKPQFLPKALASFPSEPPHLLGHGKATFGKQQRSVSPLPEKGLREVK